MDDVALHHWSDCFVSGVPAGVLFKMSTDGLRRVVQASPSEEPILNQVMEISLIGLVAYFEGFCKNQFASVVNICPEVLEQFCERRPDAAIRIADLLHVGLDLQLRLGSLLAEKLDFGTARSINALYLDLLSIAPFSKEAARKYDDLLGDRNILAHHAGIYTLGYCKQRSVHSERNRAFLDSLIIDLATFEMWADFLDGIAAKLVSSSQEALRQFIVDHGLPLQNEMEKAVEWLGWHE